MVAIVVVYGINSSYRSYTRRGLEFMLFSFFMGLGAVCSWAYLPNLQRKRVVSDRTDPGRVRMTLETKNLEDLGEGRERARQDGEVIAIREKVGEIKRRRRAMMYSANADGRRDEDIGLR